MTEASVGTPVAKKPHHRRRAFVFMRNRKSEKPVWVSVVYLKGNPKSYTVGQFATEEDATKARFAYIDKLKALGMKVELA